MIGTCLYVLFTVFCIRSFYKHRHTEFFFIGLHKIDDTLIGTGAKEKLCVNDGRSENLCLPMLPVVLHGEFNFRRTIFFALFVRAIYILDGLGLRVNREKSVIFFFWQHHHIYLLWIRKQGKCLWVRCRRLRSSAFKPFLKSDFELE